MRIHVTAGLGARNESTVEGLAERAVKLESLGFAGMWMPHSSGIDAMTALAVAATRTSTIELGTAVVPTFPRHPHAMAQQALTVQAIAGGRFTLGIGVSHKSMMQDSLGIPFERPAAHTREYLSVLGPLLEGRAASFHGDIFEVEAVATVGGSSRVPVLVAALGPAMLKIAGTLADGTITSWAGPKTLESHIVPRISAAANEAGRPSPRIAVGLPIVVTDDEAGAREMVGKVTAHYNDLPSYRAMFDIEGAAGPGDVIIAGNEKSVAAALDRLAQCGATDYLAQFVSVGAGSVQRTFEFLATRVA